MKFIHEIIFFKEAEKTPGYLTMQAIEPFIILPGINMPRLKGLKPREEVLANEDLRLQCIPYPFFSTGAEQKHVIDACSKSVQGFFVNPYLFVEVERTIKIIIAYGKEYESPNYIK